MNVRERLIAPQGAFHESWSAVSPTGEAALRTLKVSELVEQCLLEINAYRRGEPSTDVYGVELLRRATVWDDQEAWASLQHCLTEVVRGWLRCHPSREVAAHLDSEENYVAQAFARFWQATTQGQRIEFRTFAAALQYLRASLHGALLDTVRAYGRPKELELALDFLREQVVIEKYVYTCSVCQKSQCLREDDPEMGSSWDFARQANHDQPTLLHRC